MPIPVQPSGPWSTRMLSRRHEPGGETAVRQYLPDFGLWGKPAHWADIGTDFRPAMTRHWPSIAVQLEIILDF